MLKSILLSALCLTVLAGCAADAASPSLPPTHPANPDAPQARLHAPSTTLDVSNAAPGSAAPVAAAPGGVVTSDAPAATAHVHEAHAEHGSTGKDPAAPHASTSTATTAPTSTEAATYSCPHHPEVVSNEPGRCPKCKMALTKTAGAEGNGHDH